MNIECQICGGYFTAVRCGKSQKTCKPCVAIILEEAAAGISMREIGDHRGLTRNAVIGLVNRNKPEGFRHPGAPASRNTPREITDEEREQAQQIVQSGGGITEVRRALGVGERVGRELVEEAMAAAIPEDGEYVPDRKRCKYPIGEPEDADFHFCGRRQKFGSPYCANHHAICYRPAVSRKEQNAKRKQFYQTRRKYSALVPQLVQP